jgi:hypothetical protein
MLKNAALGATGIILLSGSLLLLWFVILSGVSNVTPLRNTYFLQADTSGITGARPLTQWTYFYFCGRGNRDCGPPRPAPAFGKAWSGNAANAPEDLIGSHGGDTTSFHYYYMWRFAWVFILINLFFETLTWFAAWLACCGRLGAAIASLLALVALFFHSLGTAMMTATFVQARNAFSGDGRSAKVGSYAFGFMWASWFALFLATILFVIGIKTNKSRKDTAVNGANGYSGRRWGRRKRSVRSSSYDGRRVKEEYA